MSEGEGKGSTERKVDLTETQVMVEEPAPAPPIPEKVEHISVEVVGGPMDGLRNRIEGAEFSIGRDTDNDLALVVDTMVSGKHARISREGHHYWLVDLDSRNGVYLGDHRLTERSLIGFGTRFTVGHTQLEFMP
ncbi:MAG: FHA domain-containing protein [bacterium]|nr:FHA domain-containing protein [bacterium]